MASRSYTVTRCPMLILCGCVEGSLACLGETAVLHQQSWFVLARLILDESRTDLGLPWTDLGTASNRFPNDSTFRINTAHGSHGLAWTDWAVCRRTGTEGQSRLACGRDSRGCHACWPCPLDNVQCTRVLCTYRMWTPCVAVRFKLLKLEFITFFFFIISFFL
ncbi:hypothetical protein BDV09DRAFT_174423 [Aspergillus tetrazonus]